MKIVSGMAKFEINLRQDHGFPDPGKLPPIPSLPFRLSTASTSLEAIKFWNKRGSPSEGIGITVVVSSVTDNIDVVFSGLLANQLTVTDSLTEIQERVKTLYRKVK